MGLIGCGGAVEKNYYILLRNLCVPVIVNMLVIYRIAFVLESNYLLS